MTDHEVGLRNAFIVALAAWRAEHLVLDLIAIEHQVGDGHSGRWLAQQFSPIYRTHVLAAAAAARRMHACLDACREIDEGWAEAQADVICEFDNRHATAATAPTSE